MSRIALHDMHNIAYFICNIVKSTMFTVCSKVRNIQKIKKYKEMVIDNVTKMM